MLDICFPNSASDIKTRVELGRIKRPFVQPVAQRWRDAGLTALQASAGSKSLQSRYNKIKGIIDKLRHLLINDPENCHDYIFKFMMQYFTIVEIS